MRILAFILLTACGSAPPPTVSTPEVAAARIVALPEGREVSIEELGASLIEARAIYVGEHHDREADHRAQLEIIGEIYRRDRSIAIGLEMIQRPYQEALDAYVAGQIDEAALLERVEWDDRWGFDFALYRPIFEFARAHHVPLVALNVQSEITRRVGREGIDALSAQERAQIPAELDLTSTAHRAMVEAALRQHPGIDDAMLERFYVAQVIWDETMAERVASFSSEHPDVHHLVVLAGVMHVQSGLGAPERAARRGVTPYRVVMPVTSEELEESRRAEPPLAQFLWATE